MTLETAGAPAGRSKSGRRATCADRTKKSGARDSSSAMPWPDPVQHTPEPVGQHDPVESGGQRSQHGALVPALPGAHGQSVPSAMKATAKRPKAPVRWKKCLTL